MLVEKELGSEDVSVAAGSDSHSEVFGVRRKDVAAVSVAVHPEAKESVSDCRSVASAESLDNVLRSTSVANTHGLSRSLETLDHSVVSQRTRASHGSADSAVSRSGREVTAGLNLNSES